MHADDRPVGRLLSRRELVGLFGASVAAIAATRPRGETAAPDAGASLAVQDCVAQPQQTEGPYFVEEGLRRSDIRVDPSTGAVSAGVPLDLRLVISKIADGGACAILPGAQVDLWHCDAAGLYSDVRDRRSDTTGRKFLRGHQVTGAGGEVRFTTIYPGWYEGRAVHIHFKIRVPNGTGGIDEFTSQLYFDDALTDRVHAKPPYSAKKGQRLVNSRDFIYRDGGGQLMLKPVEKGAGFEATFRVAMRPGEPPAPGPPFRPSRERRGADTNPPAL